MLFHGFGQDHSIWYQWIEILSNKYRVIAIDLPFHGESKYPDKHLGKDQWIRLINRLITKEGIDSFHVLGYSLGGRFVFPLLFHGDFQINSVTLIAPDGVYRSIWYRVATHQLFNRIFKHFMYHPSRLRHWIRFVETLKIANPSLVKFARKELDNHRDRIRAYQSWTYLAPLKFPNQSLREKLQKTKSHVLLVLGERDRIIPSKRLIPIFNQLENVAIKIAPLRHHSLLDFNQIKHLLDLVNSP